MSGTGFSSLFAPLARWWRLYRRTFFQVRRPVKARSRAASEPGKWFLVAAVLITLVGAGLRASFLNHPMRYDESMVYFDFADWPLHDLATRYDRVQNHLLHTILEHFAIRIGGHSPPVIRLPAAIAGTALVPLAIALGFALTRRSLYGLLAGGLVAVSSVLVDYSTNARGYTMVGAFTMGMCLCTLWLLRDPRRRRLWPTWALLASFGAFTIPTMVFPVVGLALLIGLDAVVNSRRRRRRVQLTRLAVTLGTWALATFLLYLPAAVRTGLPTVLTAYAETQNHSRKFFDSTSQLVRLTWQDWARDVAAPVLILGGIGLALGLIRGWRKRSMPWAMPWVMLGGGGALAVLLQTHPYPRVWLYLLPVVLTFSACGPALIRRHALRRAAIAVMVLSILVGGYRVSRRQFLIAEDPHTLVDAKLVAETCADWPPRRFGLIMFPMTEAVHYYAHRENLPRPAHPIDPRVRATYVVVNRTQSLEDVLAAKGGSWLQAYGPPRLYKTLPNSRIYRMDRLIGIVRLEP